MVRAYACQISKNLVKYLVGIKTNTTRRASARLRGIYDVLNHLCVRIDLKSRHEDELTTAQNWVSDQPKDVLMIYDRGYFGFNLPWLHDHHGTHYLLACSKNSISFVGVLKLIGIG